MKSKQINSAAGDPQGNNNHAKKGFCRLFPGSGDMCSSGECTNVQRSLRLRWNRPRMLPQFSVAIAQGQDGNLYGTTPQGGTTGGGIVFKITPAGPDCSPTTSISPTETSNGGLILGADGNLYGTTEHGGAHSYGNIFKITLPEHLPCCTTLPEYRRRDIRWLRLCSARTEIFTARPIQEWPSSYLRQVCSK